MTSVLVTALGTSLLVALVVTIWKLLLQTSVTTSHVACSPVRCCFCPNVIYLYYNLVVV